MRVFFFFFCLYCSVCFFFFFSSRRRHTRSLRDWSSDVCSSDLEALDPAPTALAALSEGRLAAISGASIVILDREKGKRLQTLPLADAGTALAADASGAWLVAGTARGTIAVFDGEERRDFIGAASKKIHEGAVTALLFDPDELRVYSAGSDNRLLLTHVRGELEPEDRAGGAAHDAPPQALCAGVEDK